MKVMNDFHTQGAVPLGAKAYVRRDFEERTRRHLLRGNWVLLLGPREHGKTTALVRLKKELREQGLLVAGVDFQRLGPPFNDNYRRFLQWVADHLASDLGTRGYDHPVDQDADEFASWLECLLPGGVEPVVVCMDEAAGVPESMRNHFYGQIRAISSTAAEETGSPLSRLRFLFSGMFQPDRLVRTENSPFNTSERVETDDLSIEQTRTLVHRVLNKEELDEDEEYLVQRAYAEVGGQPFLLQHILSLAFDADLVDRDATLAQAVESLKFSDHSVALMTRVVQDEGAQKVAAELSQSGEINFLPDADYKHLCVIGLAGRQGNTLQFRNKLYAQLARNHPQLNSTGGTRESAMPLAPLSEASLAFVNDDRYRKFAYTAQKGAALAYNSGSYRLALIGYGSSLEAILEDWLISLDETDLSTAVTRAESNCSGRMWQRDEKRGGPREWRLINLIRVSNAVGAFRGAADSSDRLRKYRNWVHPGRAIESGLVEEDLLQPEAQSACAILNAIVRDIEQRQSP